MIFNTIYELERYGDIYNLDVKACYYSGEYSSLYNPGSSPSVDIEEILFNGEEVDWLSHEEIEVLENYLLDLTQDIDFIPDP